MIAAAAAACGSSSGTTHEARSTEQRVAFTQVDAMAGAGPVDALGLALMRANGGLDAGNVALSPWSITTAIAMARVGAKGTTASEIDALLHSTDAAAFDQAMNGVDQALEGRNGSFRNDAGGADLHIELSSANRAFTQDGLQLEAPFLDTLAARYGVGVGLVDYKKAAEKARLEINAFVAKQTHDKINELIPKGKVDADTRLVLVNALYLDADWARPFIARLTGDSPFHAPTGDVQVPMMRSGDERDVAQGDGWRSVELPYANHQLAMTVIVPDAGRFDEIVSHLDQTLVDATTLTHRSPLAFALPRFHITKQLSLAAPLAALGMPTAFTAQADFSGITTQAPLQIGDIIHQADVQVDEEGTIAAAATADVFNTVGRAIGEELVVDRPFLFLVRDEPTGAILFAGQVTDPSAAG